MRYVLGLVFALWSSVASAQDGDIRDVIATQMKAFVAGDAERAFEHASPSIRQMFETPDRFAEMVQRGYPMVWQPGEARFLELREIAGNLWQGVQIRDRDGALHLLDYQMVRFENEWKINAVQVLPPPDTGV